MAIEGGTTVTEGGGGVGVAEHGMDIRESTVATRPSIHIRNIVAENMKRFNTGNLIKPAYTREAAIITI